MWTLSIHPSIHFRLLSRGWVTVAAGWAGYSRCPFPQQRFPASPGGPRRPDEVYNPSSKFWVCQGSPPSWWCPENLQREGSREHPVRWPHHLSWRFSMRRGSCSSLTPYLEGWTQPPYGGNSFRLLLSGISLFWSLPRAHDYRWGSQSRSTGKLKASFWLSSLSPQQPGQNACCTMSHQTAFEPS